MKIQMKLYDDSGRKLKQHDMEFIQNANNEDIEALFQKMHDEAIKSLFFCKENQNTGMKINIGYVCSCPSEVHVPHCQWLKESLISYLGDSERARKLILIFSYIDFMGDLELLELDRRIKNRRKYLESQEGEI